MSDVLQELQDLRVKIAELQRQANDCAAASLKTSIFLQSVLNGAPASEPKIALTGESLSVKQE